MGLFRVLLFFAIWASEADPYPCTGNELSAAFSISGWVAAASLGLVGLSAIFFTLIGMLSEYTGQREPV